MPIENKALKIDRECLCCHKPFKVYKSSTSRVCPSCLHLDHYTTCLNCGKIEKYKGGSLINFLKKDFCSVYCHNSYHTKRGKIMASIYSNLINNRKPHEFQQPIINSDDNDLEEIISEQCAYLVLYQLYSALEPYYNECESGMKLEKYLPSTQQYLLDILHYIKVINKILRIEPKYKLVGAYADGRQTRYQDQGTWETGPTDEDIKHVEE